MSSTKQINLNIAKGLNFPIDAVTEACAFLGRRGSGKTYGATKLAEEFLTHHVQTIALDPVGIWHGLRTAADGKAKGLPIPIFGGEFGDVPLLPTSGKLIADLIVGRGISAVLDVSRMRKGERKQFATDFAEQFYHLKKSKRSPVHLFLEESQVFVPQKTFHGEERMLGAFEDIIKLGRNYGIGVSLISQRPQAVHKDCLNQTEALFAFQINGPQERKAIEGWIVDKGLSKSTVGTDLSGLSVGSCFLWSPQWLRILEKITILPKKTLDASETPKLGKLVKARTLAPIDLEKIKEDMKSVVDQSKENDPKELHKQIAELKKQLKYSVGGVTIDPAMIKKLKLYEAQINVLHQSLNEKDQIIKKQEKVISIIMRDMENISDGITEKLANYKSLVQIIPSEKLNIKKNPVGPSITIDNIKEAKAEHLPTSKYQFPSRNDILNSNNSDDEVKLGKCEKAILSVLAQRARPTSKIQVGILSGYVASSGSFSNSLGKLNSLGCIRKNGNNLEITPDGIDAIQKMGGYAQFPQETEAIQQYWLGWLPKAESLILKNLIDAFPEGLSKEQIMEKTGYSNSGSFSNAIGKLNTLELIVKGSGVITASEDLFNE